MLKALGGLAPIGICLLAQACSTGRPPDYMEKSVVVVGSAGAAAASPGNTTPKPGRIVLEDKTLTNEEVRHLFALGYKPVERHGEIYYCRRQQETGSRFESTVCRTGTEWKQLTQDSKDALSQLQTPSGCIRNGNGPAC